MSKLFLVRGLPGSGKSTYANKLMQEHDLIHYESDMFFVDRYGKYNYNRDLIGYAHQWCFGSVAYALVQGKDVIVSNTFCAKWEMENYFDLVTLIGADLTIFQMNTQYGSIHNVPPESIQKMKDRWFELDDSYNVIVIDNE